jgi:hypothetical protein
MQAPSLLINTFFNDEDLSDGIDSYRKSLAVRSSKIETSGKILTDSEVTIFDAAYFNNERNLPTFRVIDEEDEDSLIKESTEREN